MKRLVMVAWVVRGTSGTPEPTTIQTLFLSPSPHPSRFRRRLQPAARGLDARFDMRLDTRCAGQGRDREFDEFFFGGLPKAPSAIPSNEQTHLVQPMHPMRGWLLRFALYIGRRIYSRESSSAENINATDVVHDRWCIHVQSGRMEERAVGVDMCANMGLPCLADLRMALDLQGRRINIADGIHGIHGAIGP